LCKPTSTPLAQHALLFWMDRRTSTGQDLGWSTRSSSLSPIADARSASAAGAAAGRYRPGVKEDFDRLYNATYQRVFGSLVVILRNPAAAEDAAQEAYMRAFRSWKHWKQQAPAEAWIYRIALNVAFSQRRRERLYEVGEVIRRLGRPKDPDPTDAAQPDLVRELRALPPKQAAAIVLRHLHGFTNREIGAALGIPERTVASRLAAAKTRLRARLGDKVNLQMGIPAASTVPFDE
jgi:RNA polymerase sigma-70 factor (ECF subfamily)